MTVAVVTEPVDDGGARQVPLQERHVRVRDRLGRQHQRRRRAHDDVSATGDGTVAGRRAQTGVDAVETAQVAVAEARSDAGSDAAGGAGVSRTLAGTR